MPQAQGTSARQELSELAVSIKSRFLAEKRVLAYHEYLDELLAQRHVDGPLARADLENRIAELLLLKVKRLDDEAQPLLFRPSATR